MNGQPAHSGAEVYRPYTGNHHTVFFVIPIEVGIADICTEHNYYVESLVENLR